MTASEIESLEKRLLVIDTEREQIFCFASADLSISGKASLKSFSHSEISTVEMFHHRSA